MLSQAGPGRCLAKQARADVESSGLGPMLSWLGSGRCQSERTLVDVEPSWSASRLSRLRPSSSQVSVCPYQNGFNIIDKVDLI